MFIYKCEYPWGGDLQLDVFIVAASSPEDAALLANQYRPDLLRVVKIGTAEPGVEAGLLASEYDV